MTALVTWAFWQRCVLLLGEPYPLGIDGYYYAVQLRALLDTGGLYYSASPVAFWLMAPFAVFAGPIVGAKLAAATAGALLAVPVYFLGRRLSSDRAIGLLAATLAVASSQSLYLSAEFIKNSIGLTVLATFLCALHWMLDRPSRVRIATVAALFVGTALSHKLAGALAIMWATPILYARASNTQRRVMLAGGTVIVGLAVALLDANPLRSRINLSLPALDSGTPALRFGNETAIAAVLAIVCVALWLRAFRPRAAIVGPVVFVLLVAVPWLDVGDTQGLGFRLRIVTFLPLALIVAWLAGHVTAWVAPSVRASFVIAFAAGWIMSRPVGEVREGIVHTHPAMQLAVRAIAERVPEDGVVIVPARQTMFMVTWYTKLPARLRPEPVPPHRRWRLLPFGLIQSSKPLQRALRRSRTRAPSHIAPAMGLHPGNINGLVLVPEATWQWMLARLPDADRQRFVRWPTY